MSTTDIKQTEEEKSQEVNIVLSKEQLSELIYRSQIEAVEIIQHSEHFTGPVPHPEHMKQYKDIDKTLPDRFTKMAESSLSHKQWVEKYSVVGQSIMGFLGWFTPTALSFYILQQASIFILADKSIEAFVALIGALATLGGAFYMKIKNKK